MTLDLDAYLTRISLAAAPPVDEDGLRALHRGQSLAMPFENFDVLLGRAIALDVGSLEAKLVRRRRGGYCFELNGLMLAALAALGFEARPLLARVLFQRDLARGLGGRTHQISLVRLEGREWIVDVGFGGLTLRAPIPLEADVVHEQQGETYRLRRDEELGWVLESAWQDAWAPLYAFTLDRVHTSDIEMSHHYTSTHPASSFTQHARISRLLPEGRVTMQGERVVHRRGVESIETIAPDDETIVRWIDQTLGIDVEVGPDRALELARAIRSGRREVSSNDSADHSAPSTNAASVATTYSGRPLVFTMK